MTDDEKDGNYRTLFECSSRHLTVLAERVGTLRSRLRNDVESAGDADALYPALWARTVVLLDTLDEIDQLLGRLARRR